MAPKTYESNLLAAYKKLSLKYVPNNHIDETRRSAFRDLVAYHLIQHGISSSEDTFTETQLQYIIKEFLDTYKRYLWPGHLSLRFHLSNPAIGSRRERKRDGSGKSFIGSYDSTWTVSNMGRPKNGRPRPETPEEVAAESKIGKVVEGYVKALVGGGSSDSLFAEEEEQETGEDLGDDGVESGLDIVADDGLEADMAIDSWAKELLFAIRKTQM